MITNDVSTTAKHFKTSEVISRPLRSLFERRAKGEGLEERAED